jgi:hypothetical protein
MFSPQSLSPAPFLALLIACGGGDKPAGDGDGDADASVDTPDAAIEPDATPEPTPAFTVGGTFSFQLAINDAGIRRTFAVDGTEFFSVIVLSLTEEGADDSCNLVLAPSFDEFSTASPSNRFFGTVIIAPGASEILDDQCGWDDAHMLAELTELGTLEVGLAQARFEEDRPDLDVYFDREAGLPNSTANIVFAGAGIGFAMDENGAVDEATLVEPTGGTFIDGLYQF